MIQIGQTEDDLPAKGLVVLLRIRAASMPLACLEGIFHRIRLIGLRSPASAQAILRQTRISCVEHG